MRFPRQLSQLRAGRCCRPSGGTDKRTSNRFASDFRLCSIYNKKSDASICSQTHFPTMGMIDCIHLLSVVAVVVVVVVVAGWDPGRGILSN